MGEYEGNASSYPQRAILIDDSTLPRALFFNPPIKAALDRTANQNVRLLAHAASFPFIPIPWNFTLGAQPAWDVAGARWLVGKADDKTVQANYEGLVWSP